MVILYGQLKFYLEWSTSLKDKRAVRERLRTRLIGDFHLSAMEDSTYAEDKKHLLLAYAMVLSSEEKAHYFARKIEDRALVLTDALLKDHRIEIFTL